MFCGPSKAFNCVQNFILLDKLKLYGTALVWFASYLSNRCKRVTKSCYFRQQDNKISILKANSNTDVEKIIEDTFERNYTFIGDNYSRALVTGVLATKLRRPDIGLVVKTAIVTTCHRAPGFN